MTLLPISTTLDIPDEVLNRANSAVLEVVSDLVRQPLGLPAASRLMQRVSELSHAQQSQFGVAAMEVALLQLAKYVQREEQRRAQTVTSAKAAAARRRRKRK